MSSAYSPPNYHATICGHHQRGTGILNNPLYTGRSVYGTTEFRHNPTTGTRAGQIRRDRPLETAEVEALRIVDPDTWARVQARFAQMDRKVVAATASPPAVPSATSSPGCCAAARAGRATRWSAPIGSAAPAGGAASAVTP